MLKRWDELLECLRSEEVKLYYDILAKKKTSLMLKCILDVVISPILLFFLVIPMADIGVMIKLDSKGKVFICYG